MRTPSSSSAVALLRLAAFLAFTFFVTAGGRAFYYNNDLIGFFGFGRKKDEEAEALFDTVLAAWAE